MRLRAVLLASVLAVGPLTSGCDLRTDPNTTPSPVSPTNPAGSSQPPASASCDAGKAQWAVGQPASDDVLERARIAAGASTARFLRPNQPITMEYFGWRLNLALNDQDVVRSVTCG